MLNEDIMNPIQLVSFSDFATNCGGPYWPNNRMQIFGSSSLASFLKLEAKPMGRKGGLHRSWCENIQNLIRPFKKKNTHSTKKRI